MLTKSSTLTQNRIAPPTLLSSWPTCTFHITWSIILVGPNYFLLNQTMWCSQPWVGQLSTLYLKAAKSVTMCLTFVLLLSICCLTAVLLFSYCCLTVVLLLSYCCLTVVLLLSYFCLTKVDMKQVCQCRPGWPTLHHLYFCLPSLRLAQSRHISHSSCIHVVSFQWIYCEVCLTR